MAHPEETSVVKCWDDFHIGLGEVAFSPDGNQLLINFSVTSEAFDPALWGEQVRPGSIEFRTILDLLRP